MLYTQNIKIYLQSSATIQKAKVAKFQSVASTHQTWAPATPFAPKAITSIAKSEKPRQNGGRSSNLKHLYTTLNVYILLQSRKSHFSVFYSSFLILYIFPYQSLFCISSLPSLTRTYSYLPLPDPRDTDTHRSLSHHLSPSSYFPHDLHTHKDEYQ